MAAKSIGGCWRGRGELVTPALLLAWARTSRQARCAGRCRPSCLRRTQRLAIRERALVAGPAPGPNVASRSSRRFARATGPAEGHVRSPSVRDPRGACFPSLRFPSVVPMRGCAMARRREPQTREIRPTRHNPFPGRELIFFSSIHLSFPPCPFPAIFLAPPRAFDRYCRHALSRR